MAGRLTLEGAEAIVYAMLDRVVRDFGLNGRSYKRDYPEEAWRFIHSGDFDWWCELLECDTERVRRRFQLMAFKKMAKPRYPPRLWSLVGYPGSGKSTFATQMRAPLLVVDADHRFSEVLDLAQGDVLELSGLPSDQTDPDRIAALLEAGMPGSGVRTIVLDSLTAIITPIVTQAMVDKDAGRIKNLAQGWRRKALAMRQLQGVTRWGCDTLWIWHLHDARDEQANEVVRATLSLTERIRLTRSLNAQLEVVQDGPRRGVKVAWARRGRNGHTLWDDTGSWAGMPEALEASMYNGLSEEEQQQLEQGPPEIFANPEAAIDWAMEQGAFDVLQHGRNAYEKLKKEQKPQNARHMTQLWVADVERRLEAMAAEPSVLGPEDQRLEQATLEGT